MRNGGREDSPQSQQISKARMKLNAPCLLDGQCVLFCPKPQKTLPSYSQEQKHGLFFNRVPVALVLDLERKIPEANTWQTLFV